MTLPALKNLSEFPAPIQPVINQFATQLIQEYGDEIQSILVYGSAAGSHYHHGISNINIAVIFKNLDFQSLANALKLVKWGHQHRVATPLFLTKSYILNSLDVFPLEFSEIKQQHKLIFGEDIFNAIDVPLKDVRLLCEQQVKGKLLRLRQAYLDIGPNARLLKNLLMAALNDLMPVFRQLLILKGQKPSAQKEEMLKQLASCYTLDALSFISVYQDKHRLTLIPSGNIEAHFQNFLTQLENLSCRLDAL